MVTAIPKWGGISLKILGSGILSAPILPILILSKSWIVGLGHAIESVVYNPQSSSWLAVNSSIKSCFHNIYSIESKNLVD